VFTDPAPNGQEGTEGMSYIPPGNRDGIDKYGQITDVLVSTDEKKLGFFS